MPTQQMKDDYDPDSDYKNLKTRVSVSIFCTMSSGILQKRPSDLVTLVCKEVCTVNRM